MRWMVGVLLVSAGCASTPAQNPKPSATPRAPFAASPMPIPADLAPHIKRSSELGRALYLQDKASAIGTDVLHDKVRDHDKRNLGGWLTLPVGDESLQAFKVVFLTRDQPPLLAFDINVPLRGKPELKEISPPSNVDDTLVSLFRARQTAMMAVPRGDRPRNSVLFPGAAVDQPESILVYVLTAEQVPGEMVFGIHYRVLVSGDGKTIKELLPLSKSQIVIPPPGANMPADATPVGAFVTHLVTDWPLETHVFVSLLHDREPIFVGTRRGIWRVTGDEITLLKNEPATDPAKLPI